MAIPPDPPVGYRWVLINYLSDEFDGNTLDTNKWYDYNPWWEGRPPAKFIPEAITVNNGILEIKNGVLDTPDGAFTLYGGAVLSKSDQAFYGYYECSFKASKVSMSTTFWLTSHDGEPVTGTTCSEDNFTLELDIVEVIGDAKTWPNFATHMGSNTHWHHFKCDTSRETYSAGASTELSSEVSAEYHTYGAWWKDANEVTFYNDDNEGETVAFRTDVKAEPFSHPMMINMVTETYDWEIPPTAEELADDTRNTSYYDFVRYYKLVPIDDVINTSISKIEVNGGFEKGTFKGWAGWGGNPREVLDNNQFEGNYAVHIVGGGATEQIVTLKPNTDYILTCQAKVISGSIDFGIKEEGDDETFIAGTPVTAPEYTEYKLEFNTGANTECKFYFYAQNGSHEAYADNFSIVEANPTNLEEIVNIFTESIEVSSDNTEIPETNSIDFNYKYKANQNRDIVVRLLNDVNEVIKSEKIDVLKGFGNNDYQFTLATRPPAGNYQLVIDIRPLDGTIGDVIETKNIAISSTTLSNREFLDIKERNLLITPNPSNNVIRIDGIKEPTKVEVYSLLGKICFKGTVIPNQSISVNNLTPGIYLVKAGGQTIKFVKQ